MRYLVHVAAGLLAATVIVAAPASAESSSCPDVEAVFARGTSEPPGVGGVGRSFVDALRQQLGNRSLAVYPVDYPASSDFANVEAFTKAVSAGIHDARAHLQSTVKNCPDTKVVLGGFSQGAAVASFVTTGDVPRGAPGPRTRQLAEHVSAVALFGKPSGEFLTKYGVRSIAVGRPYAGRTIDLCATGDSVCVGKRTGGPNLPHGSYGVNGMTVRAAAFAASQL